MSYLIKRNGDIFRLIKEEHIAWHAGKSCWKRFRSLNRHSIGIEMVNKGHEWGYSYFSKKQIVSLIKLCNKIKKKYKIKNNFILGHSDIAPTRKKDPGEKFPWKILAEQNLGLWHDLNITSLIKKRKKYSLDNNQIKIFFKNLKKFGYCIPIRFNNSFIK